MNEIRTKIKEWGHAVRSREFIGIAEEIENAAIFNPSDEINMGMYKLLLYLCNTAQQCDKTNTSDGVNISDIACAICSKLTSIPDVLKFFSGIYHIVCRLNDMKLYKNAMKVGDFLVPGSLFCGTSNKFDDMYAKFSSLWYRTIDKLFCTFQKFDEENFKLIMMLINYELKFQALAVRDGSKYFLNKIAVYNEKIVSFGQQQFNCKFRNAMMDCIAHTKVSLGDQNKFQTYRCALRILNDVIIGKTNLDDIESLNKRVAQFFLLFKSCMKENKECYDCFIIYEKLCQILIRDADAFTSNHFQSIQIYKNSMNTMIKTYGYENAIKWNSYSIMQISEVLITFWEKFNEKNNKKHVSDEFVINITEFLNYQSNIFQNFHLSECYCHQNDCRMTVDIYNALTIKLRALKIIARSINNLPMTFINPAIEIAEECVEFIYKLEAANCKRWRKLWLLVGSFTHNIAVHYEKIKYDESIRLYTLLATATIKLNAFDAESSFVEFDNPLSASLHRLSNTHYAHGKYNDAMITCALNAYIGYKNEKCRAFRFWTSIKYKYPLSHDTTIINCLKSNRKIAEKFDIDIDLINCDFVTICEREIIHLHEADINLSSSIMNVLDFMDTIDVTPLIYAQCVQRLGYHMLDFQSDISIEKYINKALFNLKQDIKYTRDHELLKGHLKFYKLIEELKEMHKTTEAEMQNTKFRLYATNNSNSNIDPTNNIVPAYSLINIKTAANIVEKLEKVLNIWKKCYESNNEFFKSTAMIRTAIIVAEYIRFYQQQNLEIEAWKFAYYLADKFNDDSTIVYITGRCISSRYINNKWILKAKSCIETLASSTDQTVIETIAMFKLNLSEFYFTIGLINEANELFEEAVVMPNIEFSVNLATYLLSVDILMSHKFNSNYIKDIVKGLYTTLTIDDLKFVSKHRREEYLYELDILFQFTNHVTLRMNSLISYREICAHLVRRLWIAQKICAPLHVAECLKNLCFIDLSRNEIENCEVKLQGLEHILMIETFEMSRQANFSPVSDVSKITESQARIIEPVRDCFQNDTSPVLRKKVFVAPNFMQHEKKCMCFNCSNVSYQYLVFSCTHIRAQLYALQNHVNLAIQHFYGAFNIVRKILKLSDGNTTAHHRYHEIVEYVLFILDFARFLKHVRPGGSENGLNIALHAVDVCERYKIINSPVYIAARELIFEYRIQNVFKNIDYSKFTMSNINDVDENEYINEDNDNLPICITPVRTTTKAISAQSVRRKKTPPLLTLSKVSIDTIEDDDGINMSNLRPPLDDITIKKNLLKVRPIRREISEDDYSSNGSLDEIKPQLTSGKNSRKREVSKINKEIKLNQKQKNNQTGRSSRRKILESSDESSEESGSIDRVTDMLKEMQMSELKVDKTEIKIKGNSKTKLPSKSRIRKDNSTHKSTIIHESTTSVRKKSNNNVPLSVTSNLKLLNTAEYHENTDQFSTSTANNIDSDDEVVECSIEEPRRSRRLAGQSKKS
ncbi:hypothetical protein PV326_005650 [Microctonus aethiopoides]|uniref:Separase n=1 Tax=Microctonus aethiopoides TaxID=144406 RepID=A0AA39FHT3_9HYME|nr:hypothetical protein PV326_005650 [Microctonus aethiopoides]KAK0169832.1 hypothetical protein PV328_010470 [Microctonus aethiopoides]